MKKGKEASAKENDQSKDIASIVDLVQKIDSMPEEEFQAMGTKIVKAEFVLDEEAEDIVESVAEESVAQETVDDSLERLQKLREGFGACGNEPAITEEPVRDLEAEYEEQVKYEREEMSLTEAVEIIKSLSAETEQPNATTEQPTEIVSEAVEPVPDQEVVVAEVAPTIADDITLVLTSSEAESLYEFIRDELLTVVKRDDIEELDWLADMCSIYKCLRGELVRDA